MKYLFDFRAVAFLLLSFVILHSGYCIAAGNAHGFLQYLNKGAAQYQENQVTADAYYAAIDPKSLRLNLNAFKKFNALSSNVVATYVNDADLGFGRRMYVKTNADGSVASCVENYAGPTKDVNVAAQVKIDSAKAHLASELLASVCMEYTGTPGTESPANGIPNTAVAPNVLMSGRKFVKFFAYDGAGQRIAAADLDGEGAKFMPGLCNSCHGGTPKSLSSNGTYPDHGDTKTYFLPWDLDTLVFDAATNNNRAILEPRLKAFNKAVLATYPQPKTFSFKGNAPIPANGTGSASVTVSGITKPLTELVVSIDGIAGGAAGITHDDLVNSDIMLTGPNGMTVPLNYAVPYQATSTIKGLRNVYFTDSAGVNLLTQIDWHINAGSTNTEISGNYLAFSNSSSALIDYNECANGQVGFAFGCINPNGVWTLSVTDKKSGGTVGSIKRFSIHINGIPDGAYIPTPVKMIRGWYGGKTLPSLTFNGAYVPDGWLAANNPTAPANTQALYQQVVGPTCRACHAQRGNMLRNEIAFESYKDFMLYAPKIESLVYDQGVMPLAKRTYENHFWSGAQPATLAAHMPRYLNGYNGEQPGRAIAKAGTPRTQNVDLTEWGIPFVRTMDLSVRLNEPVKLNGKKSIFADTFNWIMIQAPTGSLAQLSQANTATPIFTPDLVGDYIFALTVTNIVSGTTSTANVTVNASSAALPAVSFSKDLYNTASNSRTNCSGCHQQGAPKGPSFLSIYNNITPENTQIMYNLMLENSNLIDPMDSVMFKKATTIVPHFVKIPLPPSATTDQFQDIYGWGLLKWNYESTNRAAKAYVRWLLEGAQNN